MEQGKMQDRDPAETASAEIVSVYEKAGDPQRDYILYPDGKREKPC